MPNQTTSLKTINNEKLIIKELASLNSISEIKLNDTGWDSRVYSFGDGQYFFKFPRSKKVQNLYKYEITALKCLQKLDTAVVTQKIIWVHPKNEYFGYEGLQGKPLGEIINYLSAKEKTAIGINIGSFLKQLHKIKLTDARKITINNEIEQIQDWYKSSINVVKKSFTTTQQQKLNTLVYIEWPAMLKKLGSDPVFSHGDLDLKNIIYNTSVSVGVIDFGDVAYYDRSKDFLELSNSKIVYNNALRVYGYNDSIFKSKVAIRHNMIQIINLGFYSGKNDQKNMLITVNYIKKYLS